MLIILEISREFGSFFRFEYILVILEVFGIFLVILEVSKKKNGHFEVFEVFWSF